MSTRRKSVVSLISYDADYLINSIKSYYNYVDEIVLGLDEDRISWSGNPYNFKEKKIFDAIKEIDIDSKILLIEDNFHRSKNPIENDTHERNLLKSECSYDWVFSFDADEELINPKEFFEDFCPLVQDYEDLELMFTWFLLYKEFDNNTLVIADETGTRPFYKDVQGFTAHKDIHTYTYCRWTNSSKKILSPLAIKHKSFCRPKADLEYKINNFGHSVESKNDPFYNILDQVDEVNYSSLVNFKTSGMGEQWPRLALIPNNELDSWLQTYAGKNYVS